MLLPLRNSGFCLFLFLFACVNPGSVGVAFAMKKLNHYGLEVHGFFNRLKVWCTQLPRDQSRGAENSHRMALAKTHVSIGSAKAKISSQIFTTG